MKPSSYEGPCLTLWQVYDEFSPLHLKQFDDRTVMKMETYDAALDEFFSKIEGQRADQQRKAQEDSAFSKLDKIRADQVSFLYSRFFTLTYAASKLCSSSCRCSIHCVLLWAGLLREFHSIVPFCSSNMLDSSLAEFIE